MSTAINWTLYAVSIALFSAAVYQSSGLDSALAFGGVATGLTLAARLFVHAVREGWLP
jgi:hypothetical protein